MSKTAQRRISAHSQGRDDTRTGSPKRIKKSHALHREYHYGYKGKDIDGFPAK